MSNHHSHYNSSNQFSLWKITINHYQDSSLIHSQSKRFFRELLRLSLNKLLLSFKLEKKMNKTTLLMKVVDHIKKETSWNEFICSLTKEELKEYLNLEDYYTYKADEFIDCEKIYDRLCRENPDKDVHVYIDENFQGITGRTKRMFIFKQLPVIITKIEVVMK